MKRTKAETIADKIEIVQETDLRGITRHSDRMMCTVKVDLGYGRDGREREFLWLRAGECQIRTDQKCGTCRLEAYLADNACDAEHDTASALRLPLIGLTLGDMGVHYSQTYFVAWIDPNLDDFNVRCGEFAVPRPGYNPMKHKDAEICEGIYNEKKGLFCKWNDGKKHVIVPEGFYVPPFDRELYEAVCGKRVEIVIGPTAKDDE